FGLRKGCHSDVETGYRLHSTDSDDQVDTIHNGLDRCAALLKNILQNEATGCQNVTAVSYRLPTSTSALSLQHSANLLSTQSDVPVDSSNEHVLEMGEPVVCPLVSAAPTTAVQIQSATAPPCVIPCVASGALSNSTVPTLVPSSSGQEMTPNHEQQMKEADLIRCLQAHLALLQSHEIMNGRTEQKCHHCPAKHSASSNQEDDTSEEHSEDMVSEEAPVRDTSCKTSFVKEVLKSRKESPEETAHKVKTIKYLLGELRALITDQGDSEVLRLMSDLEACVALLPAVVGSVNVQAEIALALQPLRSENACLRRRLRILNQKLEERERSEKTSGQSCNYEFSLQSLSMMLQSQLKESLKGLESLQAKNEELLKIIESQKKENKHLAKDIQDKEQELLENKQHYDIHSTKLKIEMEEALANVKSLQFKLEASEKENKILGITLRQRDAEVTRLRELTRTLQGSMAKVLSDLTVDNIRSKREKGLSKSLLEDHEKQMQPDPFPGSTSVMTYFKKLEMDHVLTNTELQFSNKSGELEMRNPAFGKSAAAEGNKASSTFLEEVTSAPRKLITSPKQDAETVSDSGTLLGDQNRLDETVYIPLTSSASKNNAPLSEGTGVLPRSRGACKALGYNCELSNSVQQDGGELSREPTVLDKLTAGYSVKKTMENTLEVTGGKVKPEGHKFQMRPKGTPSGAAKDFTGKAEQPQPGTYPRLPVPFQKEVSQKNGSEITHFSSTLFNDISGRSEWSASSFSTFTSRDEEDFKNSLAALDANIARLQRTLQNSIMKQ
ncbi:PREDICTED: coiled-coil domain-containing protein 14, partial [Merops nubicus]|uniref:coiled-coil domain-containing protein 14 n=1 Tax=Merops nubicus TaxID=57421 RepID=UPI0004F00B8B